MLEVEVAPKMEPRSCAHCGRGFKVLAISRQQCCSNQCHIDSGNKVKENIWAGLNSASFAEKQWKDSDTKGGIKTQPSEKKNVSVSAKHQEMNIKNDTLKIPPKKMPVEKIGLEETKSTSSQLSAHGTPETKSEHVLASMKTENETTPRADSMSSPINLSEEISLSMNLCRHTARHLYGLMRDLNPKPSDRDTEIRLLEQDRCRTAAELGKQTISAMRMQLDLLRFAKEVVNKK